MDRPERIPVATAGQDRVAPAIGAELRLWAALQAAPSAIALFDSDHRLVMASAAYSRPFLTGTAIAPGTAYETLLRHLVDQDIVQLGPQSRADWIDQMIARWEAEVIPDAILPLKSGAVVRLTDRRTDTGDILSLGQDTTRATLRQRVLRRRAEKAEAETRAKSAALAGVSHEIRTPINGILGMADLLAETTLSPEQHQQVGVIRSSGEALLGLVNDVLDHAKADAGKLVLAAERFDLRILAEDVLALLTPSMRKKGLTCIFHYDPALPDGDWVGDPGRLRQVMMNLVGNAVKFTEAGRVTVSISADSIADGHADLRLSVEDTGIGIPVEKQETIFAAYAQVEDARTQHIQGTGLGLPITRQLVDLMGGEIGVESRPGQGARFDVTLRLDRAGGAADREIAPAPSPRPSPHSGRRLKLLAAEDNATNQLVFRMMLKPLDIDITMTDGGAELLSAWAASRPDIIFTDISMPDMNGLTLAREIRAQEAVEGSSPVPIVAMTAHVSEEEQARIRAAGITQYLAKPLRKHDLIRLVQTLAPADIDPS